MIIKSKVCENKAVHVKAHMKQSEMGTPFVVHDYNKQIKGVNPETNIKIPKKLQHFVDGVHEIKKNTNAYVEKMALTTELETSMKHSVGVNTFTDKINNIKKKKPEELSNDEKDIIDFTDSLKLQGETYGTMYKKISDGEFNIESNPHVISDTPETSSVKKIKNQKLKNKSSQFFELFPGLAGKTLEPVVTSKPESIIAPKAEPVVTSKPELKQSNISHTSSVGEKFEPVTPEHYNEISKDAMYEGLDNNSILSIDKKMQGRIDSILDTPIGSSKTTHRQLIDGFKKHGKSLMFVGGCVRDLVDGKTDVNDLDYVTDVKNSSEIVDILHDINPNWYIGGNSTLGLATIKENGKGIVDITPLHTLVLNKFGTSIKDDVIARDLTINSLFLDTNKKVLVDPTKRGLNDIKSKTLDFTAPDESLDKLFTKQPRDFLRIPKFMIRGYNPSKRTRDIIKKYSPLYLHNMESGEGERFIRNQIFKKEGIKSVKKFGEIIKKEFPEMWNGHNSVKSDFISFLHSKGHSYEE